MTVFQIYGIIYYIHFSNNLLIALIKLSFDDKYLNILGHISSSPIFLVIINLINNDFMASALIFTSSIILFLYLAHDNFPVVDQTLPKNKH